MKDIRYVETDGETTCGYPTPAFAWRVDGSFEYVEWPNFIVMYPSVSRQDSVSVFASMGKELYFHKQNPKVTDEDIKAVIHRAFAAADIQHISITNLYMDEAYYSRPNVTDAFWYAEIVKR